MLECLYLRSYFTTAALVSLDINTALFVIRASTNGAKETKLFMGFAQFVPFVFTQVDDIPCSFQCILLGPLSQLPQYG